MDFGTIIGLISGVLLIGVGMYGGSIENAVPITNFWSLNSIFIVLGGTIAATAVAFPMQEVLRILGLISMVFKKPRYMLPQLVEDMVQIASEYRKKEGQLVKSIDNIKNFFLKDGIQFIIDDLEIKEIVELLEKREYYRSEREIQESNLMSKMGVFAPAFGLVGTLIGLVFMLFGMGNQGSGSDAASTLGGAMGIALITTFYGAVLANLIFIPFSEKIKSRNTASSLESAIIIEGIKTLSKLLNDGFCNQYDINYFNNHMTLAYEQCVDYVNCHYSKSNIKSPFWDYVRDNYKMSEAQEVFLDEMSSENKTTMPGGKGFIFGVGNWIHWLIQAGYPLEPRSWMQHDKMSESLNHLIQCEDKKIELGTDLLNHNEFADRFL